MSVLEGTRTYLADAGAAAVGVGGDYDAALTSIRRGGHSGYGHSGHSGYGKKKLECCELVVDPLAFLSLLGGIAGGTAFLNIAITMNITMRRRRRRGVRRSEEERTGIMQGRID